jgi:hypothetical protein
VGKRVSEMPPHVAASFDVGVCMGLSEAFSLMAGRCSAAQAESVRRIRDEKKYKSCTPHWRDFCSSYLKMSQTQVDQLIRLLDEFGPGYFELAQLIRISADTYRAIEPSVKDRALHFEGRIIELDPKNAREVAAAVAELRRQAPAKAKKPPRHVEMHHRLAALDKRCTDMVAEFEEISRKERCGENWLLFTAVVSRMRAALTRIEIENGL